METPFDHHHAAIQTQRAPPKAFARPGSALPPIAAEPAESQSQPQPEPQPKPQPSVATAAAAGLIRAGDYAVCRGRRVGELAGLVHGFAVHQKPYRRHSLLDIAEILGNAGTAGASGCTMGMPGFLAQHGTALRRLQSHPHPCVLAIDDAVEPSPSGSNHGFLVGPPLFGDVLKPEAAAAIAPNLGRLVLQMLHAVAHLHSVGIAVGEGLCAGGFCWADGGYSKLVLAGLGHVTIPAPENAAEAFSSDIRALGSACYCLAASGHHDITPLPPTTPAWLRSLVVTMITADAGALTMADLSIAIGATVRSGGNPAHMRGSSPPSASRQRQLSDGLQEQVVPSAPPAATDTPPASPSRPTLDRASGKRKRDGGAIARARGVGGCAPPPPGALAKRPRP